MTPSAIAKAAALVTRLHDADLPGPAGPGFPLPARLTVTAISGGEGYSVVPDLCVVNVDVRLTPSFRLPGGSRGGPGGCRLALTTGRKLVSKHVGFESWLERDHAMLLDFDRDVVGASELEVSSPRFDGNVVSTRGYREGG